MVPRVRSALPIAAPLAILTLSGCTTTVRSSDVVSDRSAEALGSPARILVAAFAVDPQAVGEDQGLGARLERTMSGGDPGVARAAIAADVQSALAKALVRSLEAHGLPAVPEPAAGSARPGDLLLTGEIERIDEGNRTRRLVIGFGAGQSVVTATADLAAIVPDGTLILLKRFDGRSDSGRKPGLGIGAAGAAGDVGPAMAAAPATLGLSGETRQAPVAREAGRLGGAIAREVARYAAARGWFAAPGASKGAAS